MDPILDRQNEIFSKKMAEKVENGKVTTTRKYLADVLQELHHTYVAINVRNAEGTKIHCLDLATMTFNEKNSKKEAKEHKIIGNKPSA